ncbi:MAG TPA: aquaporin [Candidatus Thermoplasmatota archaeon]|nr:aquaporin [Candidatus Thermoplasmatota archaeon]
MSRRPELAEALGAYLLVLAGCGAIMANALTGAVGPVGIALTFGFAILVLVYALGHICGAHYNPAITIAFAVTGHFPWRRVPTYVAAQLAGGTLAALTLRLALGNVASVGATTPNAAVSLPTAFAIEALATFFLALVIIGVATDTRAARGAAGLAIGLTVALDALAFGPLTGASMNPARSLGPALASGTYGALWVYLAAPVVGAILAMAAYEALRPGRLGIEAKEPALGALGAIPALEEDPS